MAFADVAVVGAGPAGSAAAIRLARSGRQVVLVDKARFPRDKCCGDGLTTGALRGLEQLGLDPARVPSWQPVAHAVVRVPDGRTLSLELDVPDGAYVTAAKRVDLDAALVDLARSAGVTVLDGQAISSLALDPLGPWVHLGLEGAEPVRAGYVLAADGMWSTTRKLCGVDQPGYLGDWHAVRQYFTGTGPAARQMWVWFEDGLLPGYAWSFPLPGGGANVGLGVRRRAGQPTGGLKEQWQALLARPHVAAVLGPGAAADGAWKAWPIPAGIGQAPLAALGGRALFIGDAARAPDPMTGEGIAQALETAALAARAIDHAGPGRPAVAARSYERQVARGLGLDDRLADTLSRVLAHRRGANGWRAIADASDRTRRNFARWMLEDYPRAVALTPCRWGRGVLHGPPPFQGRAQGSGQIS